MKNTSIVLSLIFLFTNSYSYGQSSGDNPMAISTYESVGLYWQTSEEGLSSIRYKEVNNNSWKDGLDLVYDQRDEEYRGSIINLKPGTEYEVEFSNSSANAHLTFKTRDDNFPIGKTTILPEGESDEPVIISESGTPDAYHLVTIPEDTKSVLNLKNVHEHGIEVDADYVIIRGVEIRNPEIHGIIIRENRHDVVIEKSYITFWGRMGGPRTYGNLEGGTDSGIWAEEGAGNITIQRNLIEDPRGSANDWTMGHPAGPQGISFRQSTGGNVIRYNDIVSSEKHAFNDGIGGGSNYSFEGNMNRDSDIYGNIVRNAIDDAIEVEGGNTNVRIWGNYMDMYFQGIATATTSKGPIYMFRNVFGESRVGFRNTHGGAMFKNGEREPYAGGRRYIFHNTAVQPNGAFHVFSSHPNPNGVTRNNIFDVPGRLATNRVSEPESDYDYDYFSGVVRGTAQEENGIRVSSTPAGISLFISSYNLEYYLRSSVNSISWGAFPFQFGDREVRITDPVEQIRNPLIDSGEIIPGFNDDYSGEGPDIGAFEVGAPPIEFGRRAYLNYDEGWAPWEIY